MRPGYSFKKTIGKAAVASLTFVGALAAMSGFADFTIWELFETYGRPVLGGITVSGVIAAAINYVKYNWLMA